MSKNNRNTLLDRLLEVLQKLGKLLRPNEPVPLPVPVRHKSKR